MPRRRQAYLITLHLGCRIYQIIKQVPRHPLPAKTHRLQIIQKLSKMLSTQ
jgi:hypothetical protein